MVPAATACDCNPPEPSQRAEKSVRAIATLISCAAGAVHWPLGAADSTTSSEDVEAGSACTGTRIACSAFNFSIPSGSSVNPLDECNRFSATLFFWRCCGKQSPSLALVNPDKSAHWTCGCLYFLGEPSRVGQSHYGRLTWPFRLAQMLEWIMTTATGSTFRGVICKHCGKPVRLSLALLKRKETNPEAELFTKVLPARCKSCRRESLYSLEEIIEFPDEKRRFTDKHRIIEKIDLRS